MIRNFLFQYVVTYSVFVINTPQRYNIFMKREKITEVNGYYHKKKLELRCNAYAKLAGFALLQKGVAH